mgnify:CR=1 FL=1
MTRFAGYAAIFDRIDNGGDVIAPGAFAGSLRRRGAAALPLLWQHRAGAVCGHFVGQLGRIFAIDRQGKFA